MKVINMLSLLLAFSTMQAQLIKTDDTEVLDGIHGEALFSLNSDEDVYSYEPDGGWYKVRKEVYVAPGDVMDNEYLPEGTELKNKEGKVIGKVLKELKIEEGKAEESFRGKGSYRAILEGYLFKTKFADNSIPEQRLSEILNIKNRSEQQRALEDLYSIYHFEERDFDELTARVYREENKSLAEEKDFRLIILMRDETTLYAVISKDHSNITADKIKLESGEKPYKIIYFYKPPARQQELIEDTILYTFLAL